MTRGELECLLETIQGQEIESAEDAYEIVDEIDKVINR